MPRRWPPETLVGSSESAPTAAVAPVGPWTTALWQASEDLVRQIQASDFVAALVDGTLTGHAFNFYLGQDAQYLACYSRALAALAARAVDPQDSVWWAQSSQTCIVEEAALHRTWLAGRDHVPAGPVTTAYTDFLLARTLGDDYVVGFTKATSHTLDVVEKAFEQAGPAARARAAHAYLTACRHELEFFDQAMRV